MKRYLLFTIILLLLMLVSCNNRSDLVNHQEDYDKGSVVMGEYDVITKASSESLVGLITETTDPEFFSSLYLSGIVLSKRMTIQEFHSSVNIECLRVNNDICYSIHSISETGYSIVFFKFSESVDTYVYSNVVYINTEYNAIERIHSLDGSEVSVSDLLEINPIITFISTNNSGYGVASFVNGMKLTFQYEGRGGDLDDAIVSDIQLIEIEADNRESDAGNMLENDKEYFGLN